MKIERLEEHLEPAENCEVRVKKMGNITEVRYMKKTPECSIQKLNKDSYVILSTGELKEFEHTETRAENLTSVSQSLANLRDLLNTNVTDASHCLWVTLTYKENMQDNKRLYQDFRKFHMRMLHYLKKNSLPTYEYIVAMEPQGRGAWHAHLVMIFPDKAPFIPNDTLASVWGHGFTKTKPLKDVDNVGLYLTAYLTDMELPDVISSHGKIIYGDLKAVSVVDEQGKKQTKAIVKGARLKLYPPGFRIYRTSRGIRKPEVINCTEAEAMEEVGDAPLTFERTIKVMDDSGQGFNIINYRQFNKARKAVQPDSN
ncbi:hypothetical protein [Faecalispora jeddahensis]|uniref:rolling circle replication-associated protein n=1 Tax=Faecalispora jeddahensis TaxID=1414721 RepID=UPI0027BA949A|nr:hypothetical protein [Faecalispora jeddahensis]